MRCDQLIYPLSGGGGDREPSPCGWESGADDYEDADRDPANPNVIAWCPRCGFRLPEQEVKADYAERLEAVVAEVSK
jgi:hypothetical protein